MTNKRSEIDDGLKWSTQTMYVDLKTWNLDFEEIEKSLDSLKEYPGTVTKSAERLLEFLESSMKIEERLDHLYTWAHLKHDEDTRVDDFLSAQNRALDLYSRFSSAMAFFEPELLAMEEGKLEQLIDEECLSFYKTFLSRIIRLKEHVLGASEEKLLAELSPCLKSAGDSFKAFNDSDLKFDPVVLSSGEEHSLTHGSYYGMLIDKDRELRQKAFQNMMNGFGNWPTLLTSTLYGVVKQHTTMARLRKYDSALEASLKPKEISVTVVDQLIQTIHDHIDIHHRYLDMRKKILGLSELEFYDLYVPIVDSPAKKYSIEEAQNWLLESVEPLGKSYRQELQKGLDHGWVDWLENENKRSGAYSSGCYTSQPYILMNFDGTLNSVFTLAHEAGHSMHSFLSRSEQAYVYAQYPIFLAEVASTFNEQLLAKYLMQKAASKEEKMTLINYELEQLRTTFIRQAMFAEFELKIHCEVEGGAPLTPDLMKQIYRTVIETYFGSSVRMCEEILSEWSRIPHFYYNFYVYQYSTGIAAACELSNKVQAGGEQEREAYLGFLKSGCSRNPMDTLKDAGVDLEKPHAVKAVMEKMNQLLNEMEACL